MCSGSLFYYLSHLLFTRFLNDALEIFIPKSLNWIRLVEVVFKHHKNVSVDLVLQVVLYNFQLELLPLLIDLLQQKSLIDFRRFHLHIVKIVLSLVGGSLLLIVETGIHLSSKIDI